MVPSARNKKQWAQTGTQVVVSKHHEAHLYHEGDEVWKQVVQSSSILLGDLPKLPGHGLRQPALSVLA